MDIDFAKIVATLEAEGLVKTDKIGNCLTDKGYDKAYKLWDNIPIPDRFLLTLFIGVNFKRDK